MGKCVKAKVELNINYSSKEECEKANEEDKKKKNKESEKPIHKLDPSKMTQEEINEYYDSIYSNMTFHKENGNK